MLKSDPLERQKTLYSQSGITKDIRKCTNSRDWGISLG